jgi:hypothetical protein
MHPNTSHKRTTWNIKVLLLIPAFSLVAACSWSQPTTNQTAGQPPSGTATSTQPTDINFQAAEVAYPPPTAQPTASLPVVPFRLNKPVLEGSTEVSGTGPAGLPIIIADVTFMGEELGRGQIDANGSFTITLLKPLEKDHQIGVGLNDLQDTQWASEPFSDPGFFGDEYAQVPMVGFFYDTTMVQSK